MSDAKVFATLVDPNGSDFGITGSKVILNEKSGEIFTRDIYGQVKQIGGGSIFTPSGTGAVSRAVQDKLREIPSVADYGASTSASAATNTTAFNAAIAANSVIFVPGAITDVYDLNALTAITSSKIIFGNATLRFNTTSDAITVSSASPAASRKVRIEGLSFANVTNTPSSFIKNNGIVNLTLRDLNFLNCAATWCIDNVLGYGNKVEDCTFFGVTGSGCRFRDDGAVLEYSFVASVRGCDFSTLSGKGIEIEGSSGFTIQDTVLESITGVALDVGTAGGTVYALGITLIGVYFETNTGTDLNLQSSGTHYSSATLTGCTFVGTPTIALGQASQIVIDGVNPGGGSNVCTISGSGTARASFLGKPTNYTQSGTFDWFYNDTGTWTPVLTADTVGDLTVAYTTQTGHWTRKNDEVTLYFQIVTSTFTRTTAAGNAKITGSPFTSKTVGGFSWTGGGGMFAGITKANYTQFSPFMDTGTAIINIGASGSAQSLAATAITDMPSGGTVKLYGQISFKV